MDNMILSGMIRLLIFIVISIFAIAMIVCLIKALKSNLKVNFVLSIFSLAVCAVFVSVMLFYGTTRKPPINKNEISTQIQYIIDYIENDDYNYHLNPKYFANDTATCYILTDTDKSQYLFDAEMEKDSFRSIYGEESGYSYLFTGLKSERSAESFYSHEYYDGILYVFCDDKVIFLYYNLNGKNDFLGFIGSFAPKVTVDFKNLITSENEMD